MDDSYPGDGLTIRQLLLALRERVVSIVHRKHPNLTLEEARKYEEGINDVLVHARYVVNSFNVTVRVPPEILTMVCSYLTEEDTFSASQVCHHWHAVLTSSPSFWTRFSCYHVLRTIVGLERCKSMPIQLHLDLQSSSVALDNVLLHENKITSLTLHDISRMSLLRQLFTFSRPSVERLYTCSDSPGGWGVEEQTAHELWQDFPSLRDLFVSGSFIPIDRLTAPNLVHLALEYTGRHRDVTVQSILDMLRGFPLLETLLIIKSNVRQGPTLDHCPISLPRLRSIELGAGEVCSGLTTYLQFPPNIAVGFRALSTTDACGDIPLAVMASIHYVLRRIDIRCITLSAPLHAHEHLELLVRFQGLQASLEIGIHEGDPPAHPHNILFRPGGVLFPHLPYIGNVRELHVVGCSFYDDQELHHIGSAMPNLVTISFFHCEGPHVFGLLTPTDPSSPPFPQLECIVVNGQGSGLREMVKARSGCGVRLKTLFVGREPKGFNHDRHKNYIRPGTLLDRHLEGYVGLRELVDDRQENYDGLGEFVDNLCFGCPTEILNIRSATQTHGPHSLTARREVFKLNISDRRGRI